MTCHYCGNSEPCFVWYCQKCHACCCENCSLLVISDTICLNCFTPELQKQSECYACPELATHMLYIFCQAKDNEGKFNCGNSGKSYFACDVHKIADQMPIFDLTRCVACSCSICQDCSLLSNAFCRTCFLVSKGLRQCLTVSEIPDDIQILILKLFGVPESFFEKRKFFKFISGPRISRILGAHD